MLFLPLLHLFYPFPLIFLFLQFFLSHFSPYFSPMTLANIPNGRFFLHIYTPGYSRNCSEHTTPISFLLSKFFLQFWEEKLIFLVPSLPCYFSPVKWQQGKNSLTSLGTGTCTWRDWIGVTGTNFTAVGSTMGENRLIWNLRCPLEIGQWVTLDLRRN